MSKESDYLLLWISSKILRPMVCQDIEGCSQKSCPKSLLVSPESHMLMSGLEYYLVKISWGNIQLPKQR